MDVILFLIIFIAIYILPTIVAAQRDHPSAGAVAALNILLGWTVLGWVGALVWALTNTSSAPIIIPNTEPLTKSIADELRNLAELKEKGVLSEEEFQKGKSQLLNSQRSLS